jgi:hypothetical protein
MSITYTLKPTSMVVAANENGQQNVAVKVYWSYTATDGIYTAINPRGYTFLTYVPGNSFIPYSNLTEEQVINWILASWTPEQTQANQQQLADNIAAQKEAKYSIPSLPWST